MRRLAFAALLFACLLPAQAARAVDASGSEDSPALATPRPDEHGHTPIEQAQIRVRAYIKTVPTFEHMNVVVVPGTGNIPWPLAPLGTDVHAEVWSVCSQGDGKVGNPLMFFAVRTDTGEVFALFMRDVQKQPTF